MKIAICGDSISEGIGSLKINYKPLLQEKIKDSEIKNFAHTGAMINHMDEIEQALSKFNPDIIILFYGNVDAMTRPKSKSVFYKFVPNRYRKNGMLSPRALFTKRFFIRKLQKIESLFRVYLNKFLIKICGYEVWMPLDKFEKKYTEILKKYKSKN
ncbi:SGNH/GDSL hydrolase family protein, partial [Clostridium saudiense]|nr:SGNH/GDSL hydrolase family protein [Clostridium saudiense]